MKPDDLEDAFARALNLLGEDDPARGDPRLLRNPQLVAEAKRVRDTAADVWLAVSPLRAAPPETLPGILEKIRSDQPAVKPGITRAFLAIGGWAAAAVITLLWWMQPPSPEKQAATTPPRTSPAPPPVASAPDEPAIRPARADRIRTRRELSQIHQILSGPRQITGGGWEPRIVGLVPPGSPAEETDRLRERFLTAIQNALRGVMEEDAGDRASLVVERGWLPSGEIHLEDDEFIRHRNFPAQDWQSLGLLQDEQGRFWDPELGLVWAKDAASSDYVGRKPSPGESFERFSGSPNPADPPPDPSTLAQPSLTPGGIVIQDPGTGEAQLVFQNLPTIPAGMSYAVETSAGLVSFDAPNATGNPSLTFVNLSQGTILRGDVYVIDANGRILSTVLVGGN